MGIVDLHFKTLVWKSLFLKSGMEIYAGIGTRFGHDQCLEFEICKVMIHHRTVIVKMGADACNLDAAVFNGEGEGFSPAFHPLKVLPSKRLIHPLSCFSDRVLEQAMMQQQHATANHAFVPEKIDLNCIGGV
jgi:hypothetical protein